MVTGSARAHFVNSKMLVASWWRNDRSMPLLYCDYGLSPEQRTEVLTWPVHVIGQPAEFRGLHSWRSKAGLVRYLKSLGRWWRNVIWLDADAILLTKLSPIEDLLAGYDLAIDAHSMSVAEIVKPECMEHLPLSATDAYYSSGFWITSSPTLLAEWDRLVEPVFLKGNLWENDAFVAAVYQSRVRVRPLCGNIWHARGATSLQTAEVRNKALFHQGIPIHVLHANWFFKLRADGRRVLDRPDLAAVQDHYEAEFEACLAEWNDLASSTPKLADKTRSCPD